MSDNTFHGYPRTSSSSDFYIKDLGTAGFFGIEFIDTAEDKLIVNQNLTCKPNIVIEGSKMVLDYGDCGSERDKEFIDIAFTSMTGGGGFTLSNAIYTDTVNNYSADLSASCTLNSYTNYKAVATFTGIGSTCETNYYLSGNFENIPQIGITAGLTSGVTVSQLINYKTSTDTSFMSNDFSAGDYVDFTTSNNNGRYVIDGITLDGFSREVVTFRGSPITVAENLKGTEVIVNHYRKIYFNSGNIIPDNITVYKVNVVPQNGLFYFTIDGQTQKELYLFRGALYAFVEDSYPSYALNFVKDTSDTVAITDSGVYSITDNDINKRITYILPNESTPNTIYYKDLSRSHFMGAGIKVSGEYTISSTSPTLTTTISTAIQQTSITTY